MNGPTRSALDRLVPRGEAVFAERVWGRSAWHVPVDERDADAFADLFSLAAVDELLTHRGLRAPFLRMAQQGRTLPDSAFTSPGGVGAGIADQVDPDKVRRLYAEGATVVLQALHRTWPPVEEFAQQLAADLGHPAQVNSYLTPPGNQGFDAHYDVHDVFVLQVHGTKHWRVHPPVLVHPHRDEPWNDSSPRVRAAAQEPPLLEVELRPGDVLYLPRGFVHAARACGVASLHLTVGIHAWTGRHVAESVLALAGEAVRDHPGIRAALPVGVDLDDPDAVRPVLEEVRESILQAIRELGPADLARALGERATHAQRAAPLPPLAQLASIDALGGHSMVRVRRHLRLRTSREDGLVVVRSSVGIVRLDPSEGAVLARLADHAPPTGQPATINDLAEDPAEAVPAVATLVRAGLVEVVP